MARPKSKENKLLSLKQVEEQTGIPITQLKLVKTLYPKAFTKTEIYVDRILEYYNQHKDEIIAADNKSIDTLKKEKLSNDIILQQIEIEEAKKQVIAVKEVELFMSNFGVQLGATLKAKMVKELPARINGLSEEEVIRVCKDFYNELVILFQSNISNWNKE
jgi:hypothetical protein